MALDSNSGRNSSIGAVSPLDPPPEEITGETSPLDTERPCVFKRPFRPFEKTNNLGSGVGDVYPGTMRTVRGDGDTQLTDLSLIDEGFPSQTLPSTLTTTMEIDENETTVVTARKPGAIVKSLLPQRILISSTSVNEEDRHPVEYSKKESEDTIRRKTFAVPKKGTFAIVVDKTNEDKTNEDKTNKTNEDKTNEDKTNENKTNEDKTNEDKTNPSTADRKKLSKKRQTYSIPNPFKKSSKCDDNPQKSTEPQSVDKNAPESVNSELSSDNSEGSPSSTLENQKTKPSESAADSTHCDVDKKKRDRSEVDSDASDKLKPKRQNRRGTFSKNAAEDRVILIKNEDGIKQKRDGSEVDIDQSKSKRQNRRGTFGKSAAKDPVILIENEDGIKQKRDHSEVDRDPSKSKRQNRRGTIGKSAPEEPLDLNEHEDEIKQKRDCSEVDIDQSKSKRQNRRGTIGKSAPEKPVDLNEHEDGIKQKRDCSEVDRDQSKSKRQNRRGTFCKSAAEEPVDLNEHEDGINQKRDCSEVDRDALYQSKSKLQNKRGTFGQRGCEEPAVLTEDENGVKKKRDSSDFDKDVPDQSKPKPQNKRGTFGQSDPEEPGDLIEDEDDGVLIEDTFEESDDDMTIQYTFNKQSGPAVETLSVPEQPALPELPAEDDLEFGGPNFMVEEDHTVYMEEDMEMTEVLQFPIVLAARNNSASKIKVNQQNKETAREDFISKGNTVLLQNSSSVKVTGEIACKDTASAVEDCGDENGTKEKAPDTVKGQVEVRVGKLGDVRYAVGRKDDDGVRKAVPQKLPAKSRSKQKKFKQPTGKLVGKKVSAKPYSVKSAEPPSIFDYHDKTPLVTKENSAPSQKSVFDISMNESVDKPKHSYGDFRKKLAASMTQEEMESHAEAVLPVKEPTRSRRRTRTVEINYCEKNLDETEGETPAPEKPKAKTKSKQRRRSSRLLFQDASESKSVKLGSSNELGRNDIPTKEAYRDNLKTRLDAAVKYCSRVNEAVKRKADALPKSPPINPKVKEKLKTALPGILVHPFCTNEDSPVVRKRLRQSKRVTIAFISDDESDKESSPSRDQIALPKPLAIHTVQETPILQTKRPKSRVMEEKDKQNTDASPKLTVRGNKMLNTEVVVQEDPEDKENAEPAFQKPTGEIQKNMGADELLEAYNKLDAFAQDTDSQSRRRQRAPVCYREPALNSKLRRGDKHTSSLCPTGEREKSRSTSSKKPSEITNV